MGSCSGSKCFMQVLQKRFGCRYQNIFSVQWASLIVSSHIQVRNLPLNATEDSLLCAFSRFKPGCVQRVKKLTDYAFIHFFCREDAMEALTLMHNTVIDGAAIEVMLAKPTALKDRKSKRNSSRASLGSGSPEGWGPPAVQRLRTGSPGTSPTGSEDGRASQTHCNYLHVPAGGELALFSESCLSCSVELKSDC